MKLGEVCTHGSLKRQCEICDLQSQLSQLQAEIQVYKRDEKIQDDVYNDLLAQNTRYREALEKIATKGLYSPDCTCPEDCSCGDEWCQKVAKYALESEK